VPDPAGGFRVSIRKGESAGLEETPGICGAIISLIGIKRMILAENPFRVSTPTLRRPNFSQALRQHFIASGAARPIR
jgi:hypothetical protein